jgi:hypothetical protein
MIFKLQISLNSNDDKTHMLIYNKDKGIMFETIASKEVIKLMNGRSKIYFEGKVINSKIEIHKEIEFQNW